MTKEPSAKPARRRKAHKTRGEVSPTAAVSLSKSELIKKELTERLSGGFVNICWLKDLKRTAKTDGKRYLFAVDDRGLVSAHVAGRDDGVLRPATKENGVSIYHSKRAGDQTRVEFQDSSNFTIYASDNRERGEIRVKNGSLLVFFAGNYESILKSPSGTQYIM